MEAEDRWRGQTTTSGPHAGKSWWAWGRVSELRGLLQELATSFGLSSANLDQLCPPTVLEIGEQLPKPRIQLASLPDKVRSFCKDDDFERLFHSRGRDATDMIRSLHSNLGPIHDFVAYPSNEAEVAALLDVCSQRRIAVVPFGGGSSVVGGVEPVSADDGFSGCVALDLAKMDQVLEFDEMSQCVRVQAGMYGPALEDSLRQRGLTLRYYPQSFEFSTVGGWIATKGGGHFATGPTHIDDLVQSLRVVSPNGTTETRRVPASGAGPSELRLYAGSEGTLGVITESWLKVRPRPQTRASATVVFQAKGDADAAFELGAHCVRDMAQTGLQPANLRLVAGPEVVRSAGLSQQERELLAAAAVLLIGFEGQPGTASVINSQLSYLVAVAEKRGGLLVSQKLAEEVSQKQDNSGERSGIAGSWGKGFMRGGYLMSAACLFPSVLVNTLETACTWASFLPLHRSVLNAARTAMKRECGVQGQVTCRFTHVYPDGPAPYYTFVVIGLAATPGEDSRVRMWQNIKRDVMQAIMDHGGTSTHHHAVGQLHLPQYRAERGALFGSTLAAMKAAHDSAGIMNPRVLGPSIEAPPSKL